MRHVASYWRIIKESALAELGQWTLRISSPGWYLRRPWKSISSSAIRLED
ncbi:hypothetical protein BIFBRE_03400 [Bifidobacterium breve DSM 20213 = JCM 1192]|uniref:Uncharacterized protein n=1 Tax=Bifidobacterium breve DSM 20213 = JCM 1192 TaxID=518634 RepID=D4BMV4_BIFBR|nr:hypothetical protein BIFBRE_03400 [Bifidobacterium breve DSM 20213 = JCM 1192]